MSTWTVVYRKGDDPDLRWSFTSRYIAWMEAQWVAQCLGEDNIVSAWVENDTTGETEWSVTPCCAPLVQRIEGRLP